MSVRLLHLASNERIIKVVFYKLSPEVLIVWIQPCSFSSLYLGHKEAFYPDSNAIDGLSLTTLVDMALEARSYREQLTPWDSYGI